MIAPRLRCPRRVRPCSPRWRRRTSGANVSGQALSLIATWVETVAQALTLNTTTVNVARHWTGPALSACSPPSRTGPAPHP
jgi:hypothetical protein